jgi:hypothetical protein
MKALRTLAQVWLTALARTFVILAEAAHPKRKKPVRLARIIHTGPPVDWSQVKGASVSDGKRP